MSDQFKKGDAVELKSGGPPMTVESIGKNGVVHCVWFEEKTLKRDGFEPEDLKEVVHQSLID
jgi:uncharacterized protein YodC (DUF2158 family)